MLDHTQIFFVTVALLLMILFGSDWSINILHQSISKENKLILCIDLIGFLFAATLLCIISNPWFTSNHEKEPEPVYILFLDSRVIRDENLRINDGALNILNSFLEKTNTKIVITSHARINSTTQINWPIETLRAIYKTWGIKGTIIGSIPYTNHVFTRQQEINLWCNTTKIKYNGCVILDKTSDSINKIACAVKVKNLLNNQHILTIIDKLKIDQNPDMFKERTQTYDELFRAKFG